MYNDLIIQKYSPPFICLFSNLNITKPDIEYCIKILNSEKPNFDNLKNSVCCLALKIDAVKIQNFSILFNIYCKLYNNTDNVFKFRKTCYIHVKPEILNAETNQDDKNACSFHDYDQKCINILFTDNECRCDIKKPSKIQFDSKNYRFKLSVFYKASEKAQKTLKNLYPSAKIEKILVCTLQELFEKFALYFYKISEILEIEIANEKVRTYKIIVLVFFEIGELTKNFNFFYYENFDNRKIVDYEIKKVQESQIIFKNFFKNLVCLLQKDDFGFHENYNIFYYMFLHSDIKPCNIRCSQMLILKSKTAYPYLNYVKQICVFYINKIGWKFKLYKFKCENYDLINDNFCSIFEYNDQKIIKDLQIVKKNEIHYEKDYFFMIKNLNCKNLKANLCILPCFEDIRDDSL
ncbi:hypothetical protein GVAV_002185 [Gurleya vavrai]